MSATPPAASALIADITTVADRARGMSAIGAAQNVGAVAGPALGGLLAVIPLLTPIWVAAAGTLVALSIIVVATDEAVLFGAMTLLGLGMGLASPAFTAGASLAVGAEEQGALANRFLVEWPADAKTHAPRLRRAFAGGSVRALVPQRQSCQSPHGSTQEISPPTIRNVFRHGVPPRGVPSHSQA